ncbi:MAG: DUF2889 domain-containing protein [Syntrophomonas sp.]|nr:DUF2889 domain-containing protein [Syntrophomonas sp.]
MEFLLQRFWHIYVVRENDQYITAKASYMDGWMDRVASVRVHADSLEIDAAWLERLGRPGDMSESRENIIGLKGIKAYLGSGRQIRAALQDIMDETELSLFNDLVLGVVQAENFLLPARGYASISDYSRAFEESYVGSCRYYSNLERVNKTWGDYLGQKSRRDALFDRCKSQHLFRDNDDFYTINGSLIDSFHQVNLSLRLNREMKVTAAQGQLLRAPDDVCRESTVYLENLVGRMLPGLPRKELADLLGSGQGCVHVIDLAYDSIKTLEFYTKSEIKKL